MCVCVCVCEREREIERERERERESVYGCVCGTGNVNASLWSRGRREDYTSVPARVRASESVCERDGERVRE